MKAKPIAEHAANLMARGFAVIPVMFKSKRAWSHNWPDMRLTLADLAHAFPSPVGNVGVLTGEPSGWIVDIDIDHPAAVELAAEYLPPTGMIWGRDGKPASHRLYRLTRPADTEKWNSPSAGSIVEFRSTLSQTVAAGSTYANGEAIRFEPDGDGEPAVIDPDELKAACLRLKNAACQKISDAAHNPTPKDPENPEDIDDPKDPEDPVDPKDPVDPVRSAEIVGVVGVNWGTSDDVLRACRVTGHGQHDKKNYDLARGLKLNVGIGTVQEALPYFDRWWAEARPHASEPDTDLALFKFERAWLTADVPLGGKSLADMLLPRIAELPDVPETAMFRDGALPPLVRLLAAIGKLMQGREFVFTVRNASAATGLALETAGKALKGLEARGIIRCTFPGVSGSPAIRKGARYVWIGGNVASKGVSFGHG